MLNMFANSISAVANTAISELQQSITQIEAGSKALQELLAPGAEVMTGVLVSYSHENGYFSLSRRDGTPWAFERSGEDAAHFLTPHYRQLYEVGHGKLDPPRMIELSKELSDFINGLLLKPWGGLKLEPYVYGGDEVLDDDGNPKNVARGFAKLIFNVQLSTKPKQLNCN